MNVITGSMSSAAVYQNLMRYPITPIITLYQVKYNPYIITLYHPINYPI